MAYEKLTGTFESSNGTDNCAYYIYVPVLPMNVGYKGIIQISHGMCEYIERNLSVMNTLRIFLPHTDISSAVMTISVTETASDQTMISAFSPKSTAGATL